VYFFYIFVLYAMVFSKQENKIHSKILKHNNQTVWSHYMKDKGL